jgi:hypothetical protein
VAPQYASALGKQANCQTRVSLTPARGAVPVMVRLQLFLPDSWTADPERMPRAGVPCEFQAARSKPEIAIAENDRMCAAGLRFGTVLADAGYGLSARGLCWAVGIRRHQKVYPADVALVFPFSWRSGTEGRLCQRGAPTPDDGVGGLGRKGCWPIAFRRPSLTFQKRAHQPHRTRTAGLGAMAHQRQRQAPPTSERRFCRTQVTPSG